MQRCPYLHEMKERLLHQGSDHMLLEPVDTEVLEIHNDGSGGVATIVKLNADGYGSHTSPTHHLLPAHYHHEPVNNDDHHLRPKNAKTSLFIIMSFIYAKLLVVICIAYVVSEVVTHSLPLVYYEGFFTYLYGASILFLLYVFCFLLQESSCCQGAEPKPPKPKKQKKEKENKKNLKKEKEEKEKEKKEREKSEKEKKEKEKKEKKDAKKDGKDKEAKDGKDKGKQEVKVEEVAPPPPPPPQQQRNSRSNIFQNEVYPRKMRDVVRQKSLSETDNVQSGMGTLKKSKSGDQSQERLDGLDVEAAAIVPAPECRGRKRKTSQNTNSHGSFFLRVGAIAFGLATMIYNGLEFGAFFEIPFHSSCYQILRGVNPLLQMVFTFMQMYFIFMNSRLNIHRFKVIARFGLMHIVATNLCVWIRTLVLESLKEISSYLDKKNVTATAAPALSFLPQNPSGVNSVFAKASEQLRQVVTSTTPTTTTVSKFADIFQRTARTVATTTHKTVATTVATTLPAITTTIRTTTTTQATTTPTTPSTTPSTPLPYFLQTTLKPFVNSYLQQNSTRDNLGMSRSFPSWDEIGDSPLAPEALIDQRSLSSNNCERNNIMGTIVQDSAPYLFPFIIEYSLIGAAVIYVMWRHIGKNPRYHGDEDLEHRLEVILSRRAVAMAHVQQGGRMDCVGASKGLFFGLLLLVGSLICLILFFVLIHNPQLSLLAIYLADASHCALMILSILAIIIGFCRIQHLKFKADDQNDLNDILLRVSAFGLFIYAVFSIIAGSLTAMTSEPNLLVMVTGIVAVVQVVLQLLFISDISRRRVHLPEHDRSKPGRQIVTFLLIVNVTMWIIYTFETQKVVANPVQLEFYGFLAWSMVQRVTLPLCIFHRFHSAVTLAEIWKTSYKPRID